MSNEAFLAKLAEQSAEIVAELKANPPSYRKAVLNKKLKEIQAAAQKLRQRGATA